MILEIGAATLSRYRRYILVDRLWGSRRKGQDPPSSAALWRAGENDHCHSGAVPGASPPERVKNAPKCDKANIDGPLVQFFLKCAVTSQV